MKINPFIMSLAAIAALSLTGCKSTNSQTPNPGNKGDWQLTWHDEFDGNSLNKKNWSQLKASYCNREKSYYSPDNAIVSNGTLILQAEQKKNPDNKPYVSGAVYSKGKFAQTYGRFEMRAKLPVGQGYWPAFWLMPEDQVIHGAWPSCGEIDIMESGGGTNDFCGTLHFGSRNNKHAAAGIGSVKSPNNGKNADYHIYAVEWEPTEMRWYCDDTLIGKIKNWHTYGPDGQTKQPFPAPFNKDFYIIMNLAVGGHFVGDKLPKAGNSNGQMVIDYVRVYAKDNYVMPKPEVNSTKTKKKLKPSGNNLLENASFDDADKTLWSEGKTSAGSIAKPKIKNGELAVKINKDIIGQHKQLIYYTKRLNIKQNTSYRLSFKARSTKPCRHVRPVIEIPEKNWEKIFLYKSLDFDKEMKKYSIDFITTTGDKRAKLLFYTGLMAGDKGGGKHTLYFDDIRLEELLD